MNQKQPPTVPTDLLPFFGALVVLAASGLVHGQAERAADAPESSAQLGSDEDAAARFDLASLVVPGGLTADVVAERVIATSPSLARAHAAVVIAEAGANQTTQQFLPRLDLSARYTRLSNIRQGGLGGSFSDELIADTRALIGTVTDPPAQQLFSLFLDTQLAVSNFQFPILLNQYAFRASLSYPISDLFLRVMPASRANDRLVEVEEARLADEQLQVRLQAKEAFFQLIRARGARAVAASTLVQVESQRRQVGLMVAAGTLARVDLLRLEAQMASARVGMAQADNGVRVAEFALRTLMHDADVALEVGEDVTEGLRPLAVDAEGLARLAEDRPAVKALRRAVAAEDALAASAAGGRWPSLSLQGNVDIANPNQRVFPQTDAFRSSWDVSAVLSWSPNDYLTADEQAEQARFRRTQVEADEQALVDAIRLEIQNGLAADLSAAEALRSAVVGEEAAEEAYRVRRQQLDLGAGTITDLVAAQSDLARARLQRLDAAIDRRLARARLERAVGAPLSSGSP